MIFMNEHDVEGALLRFERTRDETPNLRAGAQTLYALMGWVNANSDGWPYWNAPHKAATRLVALLQGADPWNPKDVSEAELRKALTPLKSFLTKRGVNHARILYGVAR